MLACEIIWMLIAHLTLETTIQKGYNASTILSSLFDETDTSLDRLANVEHGVGPVVVQQRRRPAWWRTSDHGNSYVA